MVGAAGDDAAVRDELPGGTPNRERIDAVMRTEALVLVGDQQIEIARIDIGQRSRAAASVRPASHRAATTVRCGRHDGGELESLAERRRAKGDDPGRRNDDQRRCGGE